MSVKPPSSAPELLSYDEAVAALDADDPAVVEAVTAHITRYSAEAGELLQAGRDYLDLLTPTGDTPVLEAIAMELVREVLEDELDEAE